MSKKTYTKGHTKSKVSKNGNRFYSSKDMSEAKQ